MDPSFNINGIDYVGIELLKGDWWIAFRCDDPEKILRLIQVPNE